MTRAPATLAALAAAALLLGGCAQVPKSVQATMESRNAAIMQMQSDLADYSADNQITVEVALPPGNYVVPEGEPFEIATVSIPQDMTIAALAAYDTIGSFRIPENIVVSGLRAVAPLAGFAIGAWQNVQIHQSNTDMMRSMAGGMFQLNSEFIADPPIVEPQIVEPTVVQPEVVTVP